MSLPTVRSSAQGKNGGTAPVVMTVPAGTANGDLLIAVVQTGATGVVIGDAPAKGWTLLFAQTFNSRTMNVLARIYNSTDPASTYTLTQSTSASAAWGTVAVMGHSLATPAGLQLGAMWRRQDNGGSSGLIVALSLVTPTPDRLAIAIMGEATTAAGTFSVTGGDFTPVVIGNETTSIEFIFIWSKPMPVAGATGNQQVTFTASSANGWGAQLSIPGIPASAGQFAGGYGWGAAQATGKADKSGGFESGYGWGAAVTSGDTDADGEFLGQYGWVNAHFVGLVVPGAGFLTSYSWGAAIAEGGVPPEAGFYGTYGWGDAVAEGSDASPPEPFPSDIVLTGYAVRRTLIGEAPSLSLRGSSQSLTLRGST